MVLAKLFNDRQITPKPDVIPYLVAHMDRSFAAASQIVEELDQLSLAEGRMVSRALAVQLMSDRPQDAARGAAPPPIAQPIADRPADAPADVPAPGTATGQDATKTDDDRRGD